MDCPACRNTKLVMSERQGIEIDYCPSCRGVWLDRGELDKIIDKSVQAVPPVVHSGRDPEYKTHQHRSDDYRQPEQAHGYPHHGHYRKKKKEGFLGDLFDF